MIDGRTAIRRTKPSAPARWLIDHGYLARGDSVLDYGCGHGADAAAYGWRKFDPVHHPEPVYDRALFVYCGYVLNVLAERDERNLVIERCLALAKEGAFFAVRRDLRQASQRSKRGTWQGNIVLVGADLVHVSSGFDIYYVSKGHRYVGSVVAEPRKGRR